MRLLGRAKTNLSVLRYVAGRGVSIERLLMVVATIYEMKNYFGRCEGFFRVLRNSLLWLFLGAANIASAESAAVSVGDCVVFREGGLGHLLKTPTYWLSGKVVGISSETRIAQRCPFVGKPLSSYSQQDWARIVAATPCIGINEIAYEVSVMRIRFSVEAWETSWSKSHGATGLLFQGYFLDQKLEKGVEIEIDARWMAHCDS